MKKPKEKIRVNVDLDPETHKKLRLKVIQEDTTMMEFLQGIIKGLVK